jgi:DNA-binding MarR family transcriptional regulator
MKNSSPNISQLDSHLGFWLRFVSNHVSVSFQKLVEQNGVSVSEWVALRYLYNGGTQSAFELIDALGMTKGAVSKILARLEEKDLVQRLTLKEDKRTQQIKLTAQGRKLVPKLAALADQNDAAFFGHMTKRQRAELIETMKHITQLHGLKHLPVD